MARMKWLLMFMTTKAMIITNKNGMTSVMLAVATIATTYTLQLLIIQFNTNGLGYGISTLTRKKKV